MLSEATLNIYRTEVSISGGSAVGNRIRDNMLVVLDDLAEARSEIATLRESLDRVVIQRDGAYIQLTEARSEIERLTAERDAYRIGCVWINGSLTPEDMGQNPTIVFSPRAIGHPVEIVRVITVDELRQRLAERANA